MTGQAQQSESALVCAAQKGDKQAYGLLLTRNWAWLKALLYSVKADGHDVDDILQDICVRLISKIGTLREPQRFRPWLAVMARRQALRYSQRKNHKRLCLQDLAERYCDDKTRPLAESIEQSEQCQRILQAVKSLPEKYRQVFMLHYSDDLTYRQIAEILELPITTVQIRLVRARRMIYERVSGKDKNKVLQE